MSESRESAEIMKLLESGDRRKLVRALARMLREDERRREKIEKLRSMRKR